MNPEFIESLTSDCRILLARALNGKTINAFGLDGFGQYGTDDRGHQFVVHDVMVMVMTVDNDTMSASGIAYVSLHNYDSTVTGHIITDRNLAISLDQLFTAAAIDPDCWSWPTDTSREGTNFFTIQLDVARLIEW